MNHRGYWKPESCLKEYEEVLKTTLCSRCGGAGVIYIGEHSDLVSGEGEEECLLCNGEGLLIFVIKTFEKT